jgi:hypothetical protein
MRDNLRFLSLVIGVSRDPEALEVCPEFVGGRNQGSELSVFVRVGRWLMRWM